MSPAAPSASRRASEAASMPRSPCTHLPRLLQPGCWTLQARGQGLWAAGPLTTSFLPPSRLSPGTEHPGHPLPMQGRELASVFGHGCPSASARPVAWSLSPRRPCTLTCPGPKAVGGHTLWTSL